MWYIIFSPIFIDDVAIFNGVITQDDVKTIMDKGLPEVLKGNASVSSLDKTASTWGTIKNLGEY